MTVDTELASMHCQLAYCTVCVNSFYCSVAFDTIITCVACLHRVLWYVTAGKGEKNNGS